MAIFTDADRPAHLEDKYRVYGVRFEDGSLVKLHVGRPVSFKTFIETYILQHPELITEKTPKTATILKTTQIVGVEKILNTNIPDFEVTASGQLLEMTK